MLDGQPISIRSRLSTLLERLSAPLRSTSLLVKIIGRQQPRLLAATIALRVVRAVHPLAVLYVSKLIIDELVLQTQTPSPGPALADWLNAGRLAAIGWLLALEFAVVVAGNLLGRASTLVESVLTDRHGNAAGAEIILHSGTLDAAQLEAPNYQDRMQRARAQTMGGGLISQLLNQLQEAITVATLVAAFAAFAPALIFVLALGLVPALLAEAHFNRLAYQLNQAVTPERRAIEYIRFVGSSAEVAKEIKLFNLGPFMAERFSKLADSIHRSTTALLLRRSLWGALFSGVGSIAYYACYALIVWRTVRGELGLGDLTLLAGSLLRLNGAFERLVIGITQLGRQIDMLGDLFGFLDAAPQIRSIPGARTFPVPMRQGIVFEDVGFRYPDKPSWAVRHLSFTLGPHETLAIVGANGAGKSTIVKLLTRLYDASEGRILIDGVDIRELDLDDLHANVGVIFQDFIRYNFTARDNIGIGRITSLDDEPRILGAAERSLATGVIAGLPLGLDQPLGRRFFNGVELSGGEWQKIAIARAYMRDAPIMVLDEPTSALDARAELEMFERLRTFGKDKAIILISHRFSTVRMADRIIMLDDGRIVEAGNHAELMALSGRYAELFEMQAASFQ